MKNSIIGCAFKALISFNDNDEKVERTVRIVDKIKKMKSTEYLVEDIEFDSPTSGKLTTIHPGLLISKL